MRKAGSKDIIARYAGSSPVLRRYAGDNLVWAAVPPDPNLLLHLKFDGNVIDSSPQKNIITVFNPSDAAYVDGVSGQAIALGNSETIADRSYLIIPTSGPLQNVSEGFTVSFWIRSQSGFSQNIFANYQGNGNGLDIQIHSSGRLMFYVGRYTENPMYLYSSNLVAGGAIVDPDQWNHFTYTYDGTRLTCYYNFVESNTMELPGILTDTTSEWRLNSRGSSISRCQYDDFRIYNRALSAAEVAAL